ncbi:MAG TPA: hypothetical protein VN213_00995 [Solirubrobacteraceae bacterium]|nr:hypothetical protein [Solirubrobacteraceae bacterium]
MAAGVALSLADTLAVLPPALAPVTAGVFCGVTAAPIGIATAPETDRGTAAAI